MIIWIASYPKSGNTWLRSLISSYYFSKDKFNLSDLKTIPNFSVNDFIKGYGEVYQGDFVENKRHGQGNLTYTSGSIYEGKWKDNQVFGQ